jgi:hypothetical protein
MKLLEDVLKSVHKNIGEIIIPINASKHVLPIPMQITILVYVYQIVQLINQFMLILFFIFVLIHALVVILGVS